MNIIKEIENIKNEIKNLKDEKNNCKNCKRINKIESFLENSLNFISISKRKYE